MGFLGFGQRVRSLRRAVPARASRPVVSRAMLEGSGTGDCVVAMSSVKVSESVASLSVKGTEVGLNMGEFSEPM